MSDIIILGVKIGEFEDWDVLVNGEQFYNVKNIQNIFTSEIPENYKNVMYLDCRSNVVTFYNEKNESMDLEIDLYKLAKLKDNIEYAE